MGRRSQQQTQPSANAIAWVLVVLLGPLFTVGSLLTLLNPSLGPVVVLIGAFAGMVGCVAAAARLSAPGYPMGSPSRRSSDRIGGHDPRVPADDYDGW